MITNHVVNVTETVVEKRNDKQTSDYFNRKQSKEKKKREMTRTRFELATF